MMKSFDDLWRFIVKRSDEAQFPVVQDYHELEHVFNLMRGCESFLEIGTAEGNSLYVLAHALKPGSQITYVDWDEPHTKPKRDLVLKMLTDEGYGVRGVHGNSHDDSVIRAAQDKYDIVLIDAGHDYNDVIADARNYGKLATKYIIFHDINLPQVKDAFAMYQKMVSHRSYMISNSENYGYGIMEVE